MLHNLLAIVEMDGKRIVVHDKNMFGCIKWTILVLPQKTITLVMSSILVSQHFWPQRMLVSITTSSRVNGCDWEVSGPTKATSAAGEASFSDRSQALPSHQTSV